MSNQSNVSDEAVQNATGKTWGEWLQLIDAAGGQQMNHKQIVAYLGENHAALSGWWQQMVTVTYEQARGLREKHEKPGGFEISRSKTINANSATLIHAFTDEQTRQQWLSEANVTVRETSPGKAIWMDWSDGVTRVNGRFTPKGADRCQVTVQHIKLPDAEAAEAMKSYWEEKLTALAALVETSANN